MAKWRAVKEELRLFKQGIVLLRDDFRKSFSFLMQLVTHGQVCV
jgi:hypothetical protein